MHIVYHLKLVSTISGRKIQYISTFIHIDIYLFCFSDFKLKLYTIENTIIFIFFFDSYNNSGVKAK